MTARSITLMALAAGLVLAGCQRQSEDGPTELAGRLFVFNYRISTASYMIVLKKTAPIPEGTVAVAEFENPMGGDPIVVRQEIYPFWDKITLESPDVHCVRKDRPYAVSVKLVDAGDKTLQTIRTEVKSDLDQSILAAKPLIVGPIYTKNPEVFKADGSADFSPEACPAT
jgi:hypothetical protein